MQKVKLLHPTLSAVLRNIFLPSTNDQLTITMRTSRFALSARTNAPLPVDPILTRQSAANITLNRTHIATVGSLTP
jgi:hypothetical protein